MKNRCYNKNNKRYDSYGGKGVKICQEWLDDFMNFYNWSMENGYSDEQTRLIEDEVVGIKKTGKGYCFNKNRRPSV